MGKRGPAKTPAKIKKQRGTFRKDRDGDPAAAVKAEEISGAPAPPKCLGDEGRRRWVAAAKRLVECGLLTTLDLDALECYCRAWDVHATCEKILKETSAFYTTESGAVRRHPAVDRAAAAAGTILRYQQEFGMTPSSRSSLQITGQVASISSSPPRKRK